MKNTADNINEIWDVYDIDRNITGKFHHRGDELKEGEYRLVVHICIFNSKNQLLIQKRQSNKKVFPGMWDLSAGGAALAGENGRMAIMREAKEELGIDIDLNNKMPRFTLNFDDGFDDYFMINKEINIEDITIQEEEVSEVKLVSKEELIKMRNEGLMIPYFFLNQIFELKDIMGFA
ncbi:NUDIX domain-containing protein [Clostridium sp.]|uniref:NUDIX hydrolase n=1 Tax=Clostridium sp. TaxID=1506 RepID=UPI00263652C8|nr:NUDIX domain-containing protein [Clostridium sp.]